jgi:hypothetical protein
MTTKYYIGLRPRTNEMHAVHQDGCPFLPENTKRIYLGEFRSAREATTEGGNYFTMTESCSFCCNEKNKHSDKLSHLNRVYHELIPVNQHIPVSFHQSMLCCLS